MMLASLAAASLLAVAPTAPIGDDPAGEKLRAEATALQPCASTPLGKAFLAATADLPAIAPRTVWRTADRTKAITDDAYRKLPDADRSAYQKRECDATFYWNTGYGSPLAYLRPIELLGNNGVTDLKGKRIADFGCGTVGHLRLMASLGADVHGIDVEPLFAALYSEPGDTGAIKGSSGGSSGVGGRVAVHIGRWPAETAITEAVGGDYDLFLSKNTVWYTIARRSK